MVVYQVHLPQDMTLSVPITNTPIDFYIDFPDGKSVHFHHQSPTINTIVIDPGLTDALDSSGKTHTVSSRSGPQVITYTDPGGSM